LKLTETRILTLECPAGKKDVLIKDDGQPGLFLRVSASGGKSYLAQYSFAGAKRRIPLGALTLALARSAAAKVLGDVAQGRDPAGDRKAAKVEAKRAAAHVELTLGVLLDRWASLHLAGARASYSGEAVRAVRKAFARHLALPAADLTRADVVRVLDGITAAGSPQMAGRTASYARAAFGWAMKRDMLTASPFVNLALAKVTRRDRVLTDAELRSIWAATTKPGSFHNIVRLLMLSGQREDEVARMAWGELSDDLSTWIIPASRAKNGKASIVPISGPARSIIEAAPRYANALCFPGDGGGVYQGWGAAKARLDEACGVSGWVLHDLRRTVATNLQKLGVRLEVTEAILNHISGSRSGVVGIYQRHDWADEKRAALTAWATRVEAIVEGREAPGNVTPIRALSA
jgi:integrase